MKQRYFYFIVAWTAVLCLTACQTDVKYVDPTWTRQIYPLEGGQVKIDYFQPDQMQAFTWAVRPNSTYKVYIDTDMHFENAKEWDMGSADSLKFTNEELNKILKEVWPDFASIKRFFWKVEQTTNGDQVTSSWRYFDAVLSVESFTDERDGQRYGASQYVMADGSLMTIMSENLRAKVYADGSELVSPYKLANTADETYNQRVGCYYDWSSVVHTTWDDAKAKTQANESIQGICPAGWHVPSYNEFIRLGQYMGIDDGATKIKDPTYWWGITPADNSAKLNVMASGFYNAVTDIDLTAGFYSKDNPLVGFWSSTPALAGQSYAWEGGPLTSDNTSQASLMTLYDDATNIYMQRYEPARYYPVRCIMDEVKN